LVHVNVPLTVDPGATVVGNADVAIMSALADTLVVDCARLFTALGSVVALPAVTATLTMPVEGAVKLAIQAIESPLGSGDDVGTAGKQLTVAPPGNPPIAHVAASAA